MRHLIVFLSLTVITQAGVAKHPNAPVEQPDEFHFVVLGDAQFDAPDVFNRVVDQTVRLGPAFVIQVGDLIEGYNSDISQIRAEWARFQKQIAPLGNINFLPVPGNHDLYNADKAPDAALEDLFTDIWGASHFAFTYKNTLIVGVNSDTPGAPNQIAGEQWIWLTKVLSESNATHKMVFMHRPPWLMENAGDVHELFRRNNVSHAIYGHHHHYHHIQRDGVNYTMTNAAGDSAHDQAAIGGLPHLLHVSVRGDDVSVAAIMADSVLPLDAVAPGDNYDYFNLGRGLAPETVTLQASSDTQFEFNIPLRNRSDREIQIQISCFSADERWQFDPAKIPVVTLAAGSRQSLTISAGFSPNRQPESDPQCQLSVPFQTEHGQWIEFSDRVTGNRP